MKEINLAIIGGGLSGLTIAYLLKNKLAFENIKINVNLFEATNRIGGRVYTLRDFEEELYAELGAISIGDNEHDILNFANELNIKMVKRLDRQKRRYFIEGEWRSKTDIATIMMFIMQELNRLQQTGIITEEMDWVSIDTHKQAVLDDLDKITIIEFLLKAVEQNRLIIEYPEKLHVSLGASLLGHYASDVSKLSAFDALRFMSQYQNSKCFYSIVDGNDTFTKTLHKTISNNCNVMLNSPVSQIKENENNKLVISINSEDKKKKLEFDYVVMAVPLSSLQVHNDNSIKFKPPLPKQKHDAINNISYNQNVARTYFEVGSKFWSEDSPDTAMAITDRATFWVEDHTAHLPGKKHAVLEAHTGGSVGKNIIESENPANLGKEQITYVYGDKFNQACLNKPPITFFWSKQRYQQGAYPNLWPGQRKYIEEMGKRVGNIFFIGEYTSIGHPASMNGAVRSAFKLFSELNQKIQSEISKVEVLNLN